MTKVGEHITLDIIGTNKEYDPSQFEKVINDIAFRLCPTNISQVISFAEKRKFMPQKSTWFHPKPLDGLISSRVIS